MKAARFFGVIFGVLGVLLLIGTAGLSFASLDASAQVEQVPQAARSCAQEVMDAIAAGDLTAASERMYGQPNLGVGQSPKDLGSQRLWRAFLESLSYEFTGPCYATDTGYARDALVSALNPYSVTDKVSGYAREMLTECIEKAEEMKELYDETGEFRTELIEEIMTAALTKALAADGEMDTVNVTLRLVYREGSWWAVPDQALLEILTGDI